jgi:hypothetical protein
MVLLPQFKGVGEMINFLIWVQPFHELFCDVCIMPQDVGFSLLIYAFLRSVPLRPHTFHPKSCLHTFLTNGYSVLLRSIFIRCSIYICLAFSFRAIIPSFIILFLIILSLSIIIYQQSWTRNLASPSPSTERKLWRW